jgi:hypothetical protein
LGASAARATQAANTAAIPIKKRFTVYLPPIPKLRRHGITTRIADTKRQMQPAIMALPREVPHFKQIKGLAASGTF